MNIVQNANKAQVFATGETKLHFVQDGEIVLTHDLSPGLHPLSGYAQFLQGDEEIYIEGGRLHQVDERRLKPHRLPELQTGANPDFVPSSQYREAQQIRKLAHNAAKRSKALERRVKDAERALNERLAQLEEAAPEGDQAPDPDPHQDTPENPPEPETPPIE